jgi:hypothetical protein
MEVDALAEVNKKLVLFNSTAAKAIKNCKR